MPHEKINIAGKDVYIVQSHHHVLESWADLRRSLNAAPVLLTLDHHTDTYEPFYRHLYNATSGLTGDAKASAVDGMLRGMIANLRYDDEASVKDAMGKLQNDEHIQTATKAGIVSRAFVVNLSNSTCSECGVLYEAGSICAIGCVKTSHGDACTPMHWAQVLESVYLDHELNALNTMAAQDGVPAVEAEPYVLDIDLDYFHSEKAIDPADPATFYRLVRNAVAVTVATEPEYVEELRDKSSNVTGETLLERMKQHIAAAMV